MGVNKVDVGGETVLDLTGDTVSAENLIEGATAHNAAGEKITGTAKIPTDYLTGGSQTVTSSADGGNNVFTFTKSDGTTAAFTVRNGSKGNPGTNGITPTIKAAAGANINAVGTPSVTATTSGSTTTFTFNNLKGATGATGATGARGATGATGPQGPAGPGLLYTGTAAASAANCPAGAWYGQYS